MSNDANVYFPHRTVVVRDADNQARQLSINSDGSLNTTAVEPSIATATGTFTQIGDKVTIAVPVNHISATMVMTGTYVATGSFYFSMDGGSTWLVFSGHNQTAQTSSLNTAAATANTAMEFAIPAGATHLKFECTSYTSGTATAFIATSGRAPHTQIGQIQLSSGTARIGNAGRPGVWYSDTSAALGANSTFTSSSRDLSGVAASGIVFGASYASSYRVSVVQDVAFTVYLEVSADNSTFRRIKKVDATQNIAGGLYVAEYDEAPKWRYYRYVIANGTGVAAFTNGSSIVLG